MINLLWVFITLLNISQALGDEDLGNMTSQEADNFFFQEKIKKKKADLIFLYKAKAFIVEGDFKRATFFLKKIKEERNIISLLKLRYLAIISFIEGDFEESLQYLDHTLLKSGKNFNEICMLKSMNYFSINKITELYKNIKPCLQATSEYTKNDHFWITSLINLKFGKNEKKKIDRYLKFSFIFEEKEFIRLFLKRAIFTNQEKEAAELIKFLPKKAYRSRRIRELIGFIHYRNGNWEKALSFIDDLTSPNSQNIKGNMALKEKKYPEAFEYFLKAMRKKENSKNALERSVPLAWLLGKWEIGIKLLNRMIDKKVDRYKTLALNTSFKMRLEKFTIASKQLRILNDYYQGKMPLAVLLMNSFNSLMLNDRKKINNFSSAACKKFDGLNCWIKVQMLTWNDFGAILKSDEKINRDESFSIEDLKKQAKSEPIVENPSLDQKDVEELDSAEVLLLRAGGKI